jgi:hypothetical protein
MAITERIFSLAGRGRGVALALVVVVANLFGAIGDGAAMQTAGDEDTARVRIVHGIGGAGPLDIYIDGSIALIGLVFPETSSDLLLTGGEHEFAAVPSGAAPDAATVAGAIAVAAGTQSYVTIIGTIDEASVGLFAIDTGPLQEGRSRFRVINGVPDGGEFVPAFTGGEAISSPLGFGDATEYATIDAGAYDLDLLEAESGALILSLPQIPFAEGTTTDLILVGQVSDGTIQGAVETVDVPVSRASGRSAHIIAGTCAEPGTEVADLGVVRVGGGETVGVPGVAPVANGFGLAAVPFATLIDAPHAITVTEEGAAPESGVACGDIGGQLTDTGALIVSLQSADSSAARGVAVLASGLEDPSATGVSIFLTGGAAALVPATPVPANG